MCRLPVVDDGPAGLVPAVAVHEQKPAKALAMQGIDQLPKHGAVRLGQQSVGLPGYAAKYGAMPYGSAGSTGTPSGSRRLDRDPLGEDLVDGERQVGVLLDRPERQHDPIVLPQILLELHPVAVLDPHPAIRS